MAASCRRTTRAPACRTPRTGSARIGACTVTADLVAFLRARWLEEEAECHATLAGTLAHDGQILGIEWRRLKLALAEVIPIIGQGAIVAWVQEYADHPDFDPGWKL